MGLAINGGDPVRTRPWPSPHPASEDDKIQLMHVLNQHDWSNGSKVKAFESEFAQFCGSTYALTTVNATSALKVALLAAGIGPGDEVIVPGMTWPSMIIAIIECGAKPVPVDIQLDNFGFDINCVVEAISGRTRAILPTHLFCSQTDMIPLLEIAKKHDLLIFEDATHGLGAERFGKKIGTFGTAGIFSFNQKKLLSCGEGGCFVTDDKQLYENAIQYQEIHLNKKVNYQSFPGTYKFSEFQAAILSAQLKKIPSRTRDVERQAECLREKLKAINNVKPLTRLPSVDVQSFYAFCFRLTNCDDIKGFRKALSKELNLPIGGAYLPLSEANVLNVKDTRYIEFTKPILEKKLENCMKAHFKESVRFPHYAMLEDDGSIDDIFHAIAKVLNYF